MKAIYVTADADVNKMIQTVLSSEDSSQSGRATYLRSLVAALQIELGAKPVASPPKGRVKAIPAADALAALQTVHARFYAFVLAAVESEKDSKVRNSRSGFARSATSTLRRALSFGLNPLRLALPEVTKESLRAWTAKNRPEPVVDTAAGIRRARALMKRLAEFIEPLREADKGAVLDQVHRELATLDAVVNYDPDQGAHRRTHVIPVEAMPRRGRARAEVRASG